MCDYVIKARKGAEPAVVHQHPLTPADLCQCPLTLVVLLFCFLRKHGDDREGQENVHQGIKTTFMSESDVKKNIYRMYRIVQLFNQTLVPGGVVQSIIFTCLENSLKCGFLFGDDDLLFSRGARTRVPKTFPKQ